MPEVTDEVLAPLYQNLEYTNEYEINPGICVLPVAELPPSSVGELIDWSPVVVLRLHAPYRIRKTRFVADKTNAPPVLPTPGDTGLFVFMGGTISFGTPTMNANGIFYDWTAGTEYVYVENCVHRTQDGFILGNPPWTWQTQSENATAAGNTASRQALGAISEGGLSARIGFDQAEVLNNPIQQAVAGGLYNTPSYFPGNLFSDDLMNAGPPPG